MKKEKLSYRKSTSNILHALRSTAAPPAAPRFNGATTLGFDYSCDAPYNRTITTRHATRAPARDLTHKKTAWAAISRARRTVPSPGADLLSRLSLLGVALNVARRGRGRHHAPRRAQRSAACVLARRCGAVVPGARTITPPEPESDTGHVVTPHTVILHGSYRYTNILTTLHILFYRAVLVAQPGYTRLHASQMSIYR
jgi:hypothetical protein